MQTQQTEQHVNSHDIVELELCRKFLGKFCTIQNEEMEKAGYPIIFNKKDIYQIITSWTIEQSIYVVNKIVVNILYSIANDLVPEDDEIMPWCIIYESNCDECYYGAHHGICSENESDYRKLYHTISPNKIFMIGDMKKRLLNLIYNYNTKGSTT